VSNGTTQVSMNFVNQTVAVASGAIPSIILGSGASTADTNDVRALVENTLSDVSSQPFNVISDGGVQVYSVDSNTLSNQVVLGIPPEQVYGDIQFGKVTAGAAGSTYTTTTIVPVTTAVAKLDSEITTTDEANMNLVLVGGPCVNTLVAQLATAGKFDYTCAANWPASNFAVIKVVDDAFATGKVALVVAGTTAADTRLGTDTLQQYSTLSGKLVGSAVTVTGTTVATATITAA
jgi:hypothetical protein